MKNLITILLLLLSSVTLLGNPIYLENQIYYDYNSKSGAFLGIVYDKNTKKPITGLIKKYDVNNKYLISETEYKNGKINGLKKRYEKGILKSEAYYKEGKLHGSSKIYSSKNILRATSNFKNGKEHGISKLYSKSGVLLRESKFNEGKLIYYKRYNEKGILKSEKKYQNGKLIKTND